MKKTILIILVLMLSLSLVYGHGDKEYTDKSDWEGKKSFCGNFKGDHDFENKDFHMNHMHKDINHKRWFRWW